MAWQVLPAPQRNPQVEGQDDEMKQLRQSSQPDFYQKEQYKEEHADEDMLPGQKMYYLEKQSSLSGREQGLRSKMMEYFSKSQNIPSSDMQREWNKELMDIDQQKMKLQAESSLYKQNYIQSKGYEKALVEGGDESTANSIALTDDNGVYMPVIGDKEGGPGWLTHIEAVRGFDYAPGEKSGMPVHTGLDTKINYTGSWNKFVDKEYGKAGKSKESVPIPVTDANGKVTYAPQVVSPVYGTENMSYINVLTRSTDAHKLRDAANNMMENMTEPARLDLTSKFYEKLLHARQTKDGNIGFPMDNDKGVFTFNKEESGIVSKLLNMQKLDRNEKERLNDMIKGYGKDLILSEIPGRTTVTDATEHIKVKDAGTGEGNVVKGGFTKILTGESKPSGPSEIAYKEGGTLRPSGGTEKFVDVKTKEELQLNRWEVPLSNITEFNNNATSFMTHEGGIMPDYFSKGMNFFYSPDGAPNSMSIFEGSHARIVGISGEVQENFIPESKDGGKTLDLMDVKKPIDNLRRAMVPTVRVRMAVPADSPFFKNLKRIQGVNIESGVDKGQYESVWYDEFAGGKKGKQEYKIIPLDMPVKPETLIQFENKEYAKGTQRAIEARDEAERKAKQQAMDQYSNQGKY